jgi:hypothetical protein
MKQVLFILLVFISFNGFSQSVKIRRCDSLEVMKTDLGQMNWDDARKACEKLGDGWRLPTIQELYFMYNNRDEIGDFVKDQNSYYWSSTRLGAAAWYFSFSDGYSNGIFFKDYMLYVRAVREIK